MKKKLIQNLNLIVPVLAALAAGGCQSGTTPATETKTPAASAAKEITSQRAGDLVISLQSGSGELTRGQNRFTITFRSAGNNQPVDAGKVTVSSSMTMPGMTPMVAAIELMPGKETGTYMLTGDFGMSGAWRFEVRWDGPAGQGSSSFNTNVR